jgi:hypothetical protein
MSAHAWWAMLMASSALAAGTLFAQMSPRPAGLPPPRRRSPLRGNATRGSREGVLDHGGARSAVGVVRGGQHQCPPPVPPIISLGKGGSVTATVPVTPGDELLIEVAGDGGRDDGCRRPTGGEGGIGGGTRGRGSLDHRRRGRWRRWRRRSSVITSSGDPLVVAGGGGGGSASPGTDAAEPGTVVSPGSVFGGGGGSYPTAQGGFGIGGASFVVSGATDVSSSVSNDPAFVRVIADPEGQTCAIPFRSSPARGSPADRVAAAAR